MSGHCDFCGVWHSSSCCHPGRGRLRIAIAERDAARAEVERLREALLNMKDRLDGVGLRLEREGLDRDAAMERVTAKAQRRIA